MMATEKKLVCPDCGTDRIYQFGNVSYSTEVSAAFDAEGCLQYELSGESDVLWDESVVEGYACRYYCQNKTFPIEYFVTEVEEDENG